MVAKALTQLTFIYSKSIIKTLENGVKYVHSCSNMFICSTTVTSFWCFYCQIWKYFTLFSSVSIVDFKQLNVSQENNSHGYVQDITKFQVIDFWTFGALELLVEIGVCGWKAKKIILLFPKMRVTKKKSSPGRPEKSFFINLMELFKQSLNLKNYSNGTFLCWKTKSSILYCLKGKKKNS